PLGGCFHYFHPLKQYSVLLLKKLFVY
ncbi:hypothetical protein CP8484711_1849B, partial [Chlamydia psittaci 84-8471/1]